MDLENKIKQLDEDVRRLGEMSKSLGESNQTLMDIASELSRDRFELLRALTFWFPDKEDSRAIGNPIEWERDTELLDRLGK
jgi:hypothetical protein